MQFNQSQFEQFESCMVISSNNTCSNKPSLWKALQYENKRKQKTAFPHLEDDIVKFENVHVRVRG